MLRRGAAVEQLLGEPVQFHPRVLAVGQHRVDPRARPADRGDPVESVLAAENRERAGAAGLACVSISRTASGVRKPSSRATPRSRSWSWQPRTRAWYSWLAGSPIG